MHAVQTSDAWTVGGHSGIRQRSTAYAAPWCHRRGLAGDVCSQNFRDAPSTTKPLHTLPNRSDDWQECVQCDGSPSGQATSLINGTCVVAAQACGEGCTSCTAGGTCSACGTGLGLEGGRCQPCAAGSGCEQCDGDVKRCTLCEYGKALSDGRCVGCARGTPCRPGVVSFTGQRCNAAQQQAGPGSCVMRPCCEAHCAMLCYAVPLARCCTSGGPAAPAAGRDLITAPCRDYCPACRCSQVLPAQLYELPPKSRCMRALQLQLL